MEMVAIISIPQGWKATKFRINASTALVVDAYKIYNTATTGSTNLTYGTKYTNNEINLNQTLDVAIVRGITYQNEDNDDQTYVWGVNTQFPANEVPEEYSLTVVIEEFIFTIGPDGGGIGLNPGDVDYVKK